MSNEKNDDTTKTPQPDDKANKKIPDQINSDDARRAAIHEGHPVSRDQDEIGTKEPSKE